MNTRTMAPQPGFLLIDKPEGISSFGVIRQLRKITGIKKIGHTGTLDPFATGLLICALGNYTRLCQILEAEDKSYVATIKLGERTITGDTESEVVETNSDVPDTIDIECLSKAATNLKELPTPSYSAVKIAGKPAYELARKGITVELPPRPVQISEFCVIAYNAPYLTYSCRVNKGTYIRSLSEKIAEILGTVAHTVSLQRSSIGSIELAEACRLDALTRENYAEHYFPVKRLFSKSEWVTLTPDKTAQLQNGQPAGDEGPDQDKVFVQDSNGLLLSLAKRSDNNLFPILNLNRG
jgi:tRNA pseudouridine55 synthase